MSTKIKHIKEDITITPESGSVVHQVEADGRLRQVDESDIKETFAYQSEITAFASDAMQFTGSGTSASPLKLKQSANYTLLASSWVAGSQAITISGLLTTHDVLISGTFANRVLLGSSGIDAVITADTITFTAITTPATNIVINLKIV